MDNSASSQEGRVTQSEPAQGSYIRQAAHHGQPQADDGLQSLPGVCPWACSLTFPVQTSCSLLLTSCCSPTDLRAAQPI